MNISGFRVLIFKTTCTNINTDYLVIQNFTNIQRGEIVENECVYGVKEVWLNSAWDWRMKK